MRLPNPEWVELPYKGQLVTRLGVGGAIFFQSPSEDWTTQPCTDCRYVAVEDVMNRDSRLISGEVTGADLPSIANPTSGWIRAAPDRSGIITGTNNRLKIVRFDDAESPIEITALDSPGAFSLPEYWSNGTEEDEN